MKIKLYAFYSCPYLSEITTLDTIANSTKPQTVDLYIDGSVEMVVGSTVFFLGGRISKLPLDEL